MKYNIATRGSKLALCQAGLAQSLLRQRYPDHDWSLQIITTTGDRITDRPLSEFGGKGAFLKEIEEALLRGDAHVAVHSLKDVPSIETTGLQISAYLPREDPRDVWISRQEEWPHLPHGKTVGTSSLRRQILLRFFRPDLKVEMLRGNLDTRLKKLEQGQYDAIVLAAAGLNRLALYDEEFMHPLSEDAFIPAAGQGIIAIQTRSGDPCSELVAALNDPASSGAAGIEREFLSYYEGGCMLPVGALATFADGRWKFRAFIGGIRSGRMAQDIVEDADPKNCAPRMRQALEEQGALDLLKELEHGV